jgi:pentatricopeptide repeat protein
MKRLSTGLFCSVILLICLAVIGLRQSVERDDGQLELLKKKLAYVEKEAAESDFRERLARDESRETREIIAQNLPAALKDRPKDSTTYEIRNIASVLNSTNSSLQIERASSLLEKAKEDFRTKNFEQSNLRLSRLIKLYPDSLHGPEARFLLVEGYFQARDYEACIEVVEEMIRLYPESELTGFALLRLGRIYEGRDRIEDAAEIYRSVVSHFSQTELKRQAQLSLKAVDL